MKIYLILKIVKKNLAGHDLLLILPAPLCFTTHGSQSVSICCHRIAATLGLELSWGPLVTLLHRISQNTLGTAGRNHPQHPATYNTKAESFT